MSDRTVSDLPTGDERAPFPLVFGLDTFGDVTQDTEDRPLSHAQTIRNVVEQGVLAEQVGVDFFGIGEHHTDDFPMPAGDLVLAAIAPRTTRMRLGSAVTVLSSDDPVACSSATPHSTPSPGTGGGHPRAGLQHRLVPALRLRPGRLRGALRGEDRAVRPAAQGRTRQLEGHDPGPAPRSGRRTAPRVRALPGMARRGRQSGIGHSRRPARLLAHAGDHRRAPGALRALRPALSSSPRDATDNRIDQSACIRPVTSRPPTSRPARSSGRTISRSSATSARPAASPCPPKSRSCVRSDHRSALRRIAGHGGPQDRRQPSRPRREPLRPQVRHGRPLPSNRS